jgi:hypothetical protein
MNLPNGSKVRPFAFASIYLIASVKIEKCKVSQFFWAYCSDNLRYSLTFQMQIVESVAQDTKCRLSGLQAKSEIAKTIEIRI